MRKSIIPRVFISYSWDDIDRELLEYIIHYLEELSDNQYEIIYDKQKSVGDDISAFMDMLKTVDAVLIICTPSYKEKVLNRQPSGVYNEFKLIIDRYSEVKDYFALKGDRKFFDILPILFSGTREKSVPKEIENILSEDLTGLYPSKNKEGTFVLPKEVRSKYYSKFKNISSRIKAIQTIKKESYKETWKELFKLLFKESKSQWHMPESRKYVDQIFVKTSAYKKVRDQDIWFFIGRKGSGKTTLTDMLPIIHYDKYELIVKIEAEDIYLQTIYSLFASSPGFDADTKEIYPRTRVLQFAWEIFLILSTMYYLVKNGNCKSVRILTSFIEKILNDNISISYVRDFNVFFNYSFIELQNYLNASFKNSRAESLGSDLASDFNITKFRNYVIPENIHSAFLDCLENINKNILLTFDGFDSIFDEFRKESLLTGNIDEFNKRSSFEVSWLSALILLILNQGVSRHSKYPLYDKLYYCITIPKDRFIEVQKKDRDTFRHFSKFSYLNWTGIELAILLRKRLEELSSIYTKPDDKVENRLKEIFTKGFPNLPFHIEFSFNERKYKIPLFIYVLRHTFWRPRDILFYFTGILSLNRELIKKKSKINSEAIRAIIKRTTYKVIDSEFMNEFETTILNFRSVINIFKGQNQFIGFSEISSLIGDVVFQRQTSLDPIKSIYDKIYYLFDIGFIGVVASEEMQKDFKIFKYAFSFNEGDFVLKRHFDKNSMQSLKYLIHPIFSEYLNLDTSKNEELVMNYSWEYLHKQEAFNNIDI